MSKVPARSTAARFSHFKPSALLAARFERHQRAHGTAAAIEKLLDSQRSVALAKPRPGEIGEGVRRLLEMVAERHGVPVRSVTGMNRGAKAVEARHEAWFRIGACGFSGPRIAKMFRCDPSSVVTARQAFRERHPELVAQIEEAAARPSTVVADARRAA